MNSPAFSLMPSASFDTVKSIEHLYMMMLAEGNDQGMKLIETGEFISASNMIDEYEKETEELKNDLDEAEEKLSEIYTEVDGLNDKLKEANKEIEELKQLVEVLSAYIVEIEG